MTPDNHDNSQRELPATGGSYRGELAGRFVVECDGIRHIGLAAHEAMELLAASPVGATHPLLLIHHICDRGTMALIGVEPAALSRSSGAVFWFEDVRVGRAAYESLINRENGVGVRSDRCAAPPCRLEVRFARVPDHIPPVALEVRFPEPCFDAAMRWMRHAMPGTVVPQEAGRTALHAFDESVPQIMESATIEPL